VKRSRIGALDEFKGRYLCSLEKEFLPHLQRWRNTQINILRQFKPLTSCDQERWFEELLKDSSQVLFGIKIYDDSTKKDNLIGYSGITYIDYKNRRGELSFLIDTERSNDNEVYKEDFLSVLYMLCRYAFYELDLKKLYTETLSFRKEHINILEEFGFRKDGVLRAHYFTDGKYHDAIIHSFMFEDWRQRANKMHAL